MTSDTSTTAQGNSFRDHIRRLIELTPGCINVDTEVQIGTQPVDIHYLEITSFTSIRVACECKDYGKRLTKGFIASEIVPRYGPLLKNGLVDAVRIIAPLQLNATASAYLKEVGFTFQTPEQVASKVMDFRPYLNGLVTAFSEDGLSNYYIRPTVGGGLDLEEEVLSWISGESARPVAVLAGYGMGKTSFARRLAQLLAEQVAESQSRIPIFVPLSEISAEQDLEGLLGKLLAAHTHVRGYHFETFMEFNRQGRFVIILDGFDEMKHTISWADFQHNFSQLNRLNVPHSRVLLLGRPSALLSEDEELYVLRGKRREGSKTYIVPGAPEYRELVLQPFSGTQALEFIRRYAEYRLTTDIDRRETQIAVSELTVRVDNIQNDSEMMNLVLRPVQAKMLADLALDPDVEWRRFSRYDLYREFIQRITTRDAQKPSRSSFDMTSRLTFIRRLAWWVWNRSSASGFSADLLPDSLMSGLHSRDTGASPQSVKRDLVAGSLLEKKTGDNYYFPHRSFLEFLVAEFVCLEGTGPNAPTREALSSALSSEVQDFVRESGQAMSLSRWAFEIDEEKGPLSGEFLSLIAWAISASNTEPDAHAISATSPRTMFIDFYRCKLQSEPPAETAGKLRSAFNRTTDNQTRLSCLLALLQLQSGSEDDREHIRRIIVGLVIIESLDEMSRLIEQASRGSIAIERRNPFVQIMVGSFSARPDAASVTVQLSALYDNLKSALEPKWRMPETPGYLDDSVVINLKDLVPIDGILALSKRGGVVTRFFRKFPDPTLLVPITSKTQRRN